MNVSSGDPQPIFSNIGFGSPLDKASLHCGDVFLATWMISNDIICRDQIIQYTSCSPEIGQYFLINSLRRISGTNPRAKNIENAPAMIRVTKCFFTQIKSFKPNLTRRKAHKVATNLNKIET